MNLYNDKKKNIKGWLESDCNKQRENFQQHKSNELQVLRGAE